MKCLGCHNEMVARWHGEVHIDQCPNCEGTWLDWGELGPILENAEKVYSPEAWIDAVSAKGVDRGNPLPKACPLCEGTLVKFEYGVNSGIFLERCPVKHGLWLGPGELERIQILVEKINRQYSLPDTDEAPPATGGLRCPRCRERLFATSYEGVLLDACSRCGGCWCDEPGLGRILKRRQVTFAPTDHPEIQPDRTRARVSKPQELIPQLPCPSCDTLMKRSNYQYSSGIILDTCPHKHGIWLDKGELEKVQIFKERWESKG